MLLHDYVAYKIWESDRLMRERTLEFEAKAYENEAIPPRNGWLMLLTMIMAGIHYPKS